METDEELIAGLRQRDKRFARGIALRVVIVLILGGWAWTLFGEADVGGFFARGFGAITEPQ